MLDNVKIAFFGTTDYVIPVLERLLETRAQITVVTAPDKPTGRKQIMTSSPVHAVADAAHLPVLTPESMRDFAPVLAQIKPDVCILVAYSKILPEAVLKVPKFGFVNVHPSLLPHYRGPSPVQTAILNGERETGVSIMLLDEEVDHGPILATEPYDIPDHAHHPEVIRELFNIGADLLIKTLPAYLNGEIKPQVQDHPQATFTKRFKTEDGKIDWTRPSEMIFNQIRALSDEPGTWTTYLDKTLKILQAEPFFSRNTQDKPGTVVMIEGAVAVRTGSHYLKLDRIQLQASRAMTAREFAQGHPEFIGSALS